MKTTGSLLKPGFPFFSRRRIHERSESRDDEPETEYYFKNPQSKYFQTRYTYQLHK